MIGAPTPGIAPAAPDRPPDPTQARALAASLRQGWTSLAHHPCGSFLTRDGLLGGTCLPRCAPGDTARRARRAWSVAPSGPAWVWCIDGDWADTDGMVAAVERWLRALANSPLAADATTTHAKAN